MDTNTSLLLAKGVGLEQKPTALSFSVCTGACQIKCLLLVLAARFTLGVHIKNFHFDITPLCAWASIKYTPYSRCCVHVQPYVRLVGQVRVTLRKS